uniref:PCFS4-like zinc finger domain-containing protein n=1 Tax=Tetraselmis chuii TaxID=63592 RepID=A0A7S1T3W2_9CHLO
MGQHGGEARRAPPPHLYAPFPTIGGPPMPSGVGEVPGFRPQGIPPPDYERRGAPMMPPEGPSVMPGLPSPAGGFMHGPQMENGQLFHPPPVMSMPMAMEQHVLPPFGNFPLQQQPPPPVPPQQHTMVPLSQPPPAAPQPQPQAPQPPDTSQLLNQLLSTGLLNVLPNLPPPMPPPAAPAPTPSPTVAALPGTPPPMPTPPVNLTFDSPAFQTTIPGAVDELLASGQALRSKHLDWKFQRKRRQRANHTASRHWFLPSALWVSGAQKEQNDSTAPIFFNNDDLSDHPVQQRFSVPADDSQTTCAISAERFEEFFDEATQEWRYRDAKVLKGPEARKYNVPEGSIVLVSCLTSATVLDSEIGSVVAVTADMQDVAKELSGVTEEEVVAYGEEAGKRKAEEDAAGVEEKKVKLGHGV